MEIAKEISKAPVSLVGPGALNKFKKDLQSSSFKRILLITEPTQVDMEVGEKVEDVLMECGLDYIVFEGVKKNPTIRNVEVGLQAYQQNSCDGIIMLGGGSAQNCGKAVGVLATNGGEIRDYEGINVSQNKSAPLIAINTTAGTAGNVDINYVITDEKRKVKIRMVDKNCLADIVVNDPILMVNAPRELSA